jgi:hypothetical protein
MKMRQDTITLPAQAATSPHDPGLRSAESTCDEHQTTLARSRSRKEQGMPRRMRQIVVGVVTIASVVLALLAGVVVAPRTAHAATQVMVFQFHGETALANFDSIDATGCIETSVILSGGESITLNRPGTGAPPQMLKMVVEISQFNNCTGFLLLSAVATSSVIDFHLAADLSSATLTASQVATVNEVTGTPFNIDVTMTWAGTGSTTRQATHEHFSAPGLLVNGIVVGFTRAAVATGTITDGTTNFTPTPSSSAMVSKVTSGEITVTQG